MDLVFQGVPGNAHVTLQRVDGKHGNVLPRYGAMGKPLDPTPAQVEQLNRETALTAAEQTHLSDGRLTLELEPNALVLVKVDR
jgi:xylan 1,4-beta-xylosidase